MTLKKLLAAAAALAFGFAVTASAQDTLRVSVLGDSYSTFRGCVNPSGNRIWYPRDPAADGTVPNDVVLPEQTWWAQLVADMGYKLEMNNSYSGSTVCFTGYKNSLGQHMDYTENAFVTRCGNLGDPDIILIFGGTNDSWCGAEVGEYKWKKWTRKDMFFFRPAMAKMCSEIKSLYPGARVIFILNSQLREDINESVHKVCRHYRIDCVDLHDIEKQLGHPSQAGMTAIAKQIEEIL